MSGIAVGQRTMAQVLTGPNKASTTSLGSACRFVERTMMLSIRSCISGTRVGSSFYH